MRLPPYLSGLLAAIILTSCQSTTFTGRRWYVHSPEASCRFWGYLKKPGQSWHQAQLVVMDENSGVSPPDRAAVAPGPPFYGDDHNCEYAIEGRYTGKKAYDPNSDLELPTFAASSFRVINRNPGPLPGVPLENNVIPGREGTNQLFRRLPH